MDPQTVSMVVTGNFEVKASCPPPSCPNGCNGAGKCEGIYCHCDLYHMGEACELSTTRLDSAHADWVDLEPDETTFLYFNVSAFNQSWRLVIEPAYSAARFSVMLAIHRKPSHADHDLLLRHVSGVTVITSSSFSFSTQGVWVLAIHASLFSNQFAASVHLETSSGGNGDLTPASTSSTTSSFETTTTTTAAATVSAASRLCMMTDVCLSALALCPQVSRHLPGSDALIRCTLSANTVVLPRCCRQHRWCPSARRSVTSDFLFASCHFPRRIVKVTEAQSASSPASRRLLTSSNNVVITTSITSPTVSSANQVVSKITMSKLNDNLQQQAT